MPEDILEELAEKLSLRLAGKLEKKEIGIPEMAAAIDRFFEVINKSRNIEKIKTFVESV